MQQEIWLRIKGYENKYEVSNLGRVRSLPRLLRNGEIKPSIILKQYFSAFGYRKVCLQQKNKIKHCFVHRLVAQAFLPNPLNKPQINHINGIKADNNLNNLEWCTGSENMLHAYRTGLCNKEKQKKEFRSKRVVEIENDIVIATYKSAKQLSKERNVALNCVYNRIKYKVIKNGRLWLYEEDYLKEKNECCHSF